MLRHQSCVIIVKGCNYKGLSDLYSRTVTILIDLQSYIHKRLQTLKYAKSKC